MVGVELTLDGGIEGLDVLRTQGSKTIRQLKLLRLTNEKFTISYGLPLRRTHVNLKITSQAG
jgi:hypothetical protein